MRDVDDAVLAVANAIDGLNIHDGLLVIDPNTKIVTYDVPYAVYYSGFGNEFTPRLTGRTTMVDVPFRFTTVGLSREQVKWGMERLRSALVGRRLVLAGRRTWLIKLDESQTVFRDDDAIRPDGSPLFYGVDIYSVQVTKTPAQPELA